MEGESEAAREQAVSAHLVFEFNDTEGLAPGDVLLVEQLCVQLGFNCTKHRKVVSPDLPNPHFSRICGNQRLAACCLGSNHAQRQL